MKGFMFFLIYFMLAMFLVCDFSWGKECSNTPGSISTKSFRYQISKNQTLKDQLNTPYYLKPIRFQEPRRITEGDELNWEIMCNQTIRNSKQFKVPGDLLKEVSLHDVRLEPHSLYWQAQQTNLKYLLMLDADSLVWNFRKTAGLPAPGKPYGGWEAEDCEIRGHFVGHFLSASAQMWASTHNDTLRKKMSAVVYALHECQQEIGTGYLSAFPSEEFDRVEDIVYVWAPYYTIHKILAGLLDQYSYAHDTRALKMATWMAEYFYNRVRKLILRYSIAKHYVSLNEESGGMNEVLYRLYNITGNTKHLVLAHLFDKPCFLGGLAVKEDDLFDFHANSHIPIVVGSQLRYEITGDPVHREIATFFMDTVNSSHTFATGGSTIDEHWKEPKRLASYLKPENEESCSTYNMLKISRNLFRWTKEVMYADHYERALTNGILSIQRGTEPGVMLYMLPLGPGNSKAISNHGWGTPFDSFWCCYGTGIESFSKLGDSIYFEEEGEVPGLYIIQYTSSTFRWKSGQILINQKVDPVVSVDHYLRVTITFPSDMGKSQLSTLNLRIPTWTHLEGAEAAINDESLQIPASGTFLSITRRWSPDDKITIKLPISLRLEKIKDDRPEYASIQAILYGPYLLAGHTTGDWDIKNVSAESLSEWVTPIPAAYNDHLVTLTQKSRNSTYFLMNSKHIITMGNHSRSGNNSALHSTFRLILADKSSPNLSTSTDAIGKSVMLEPFDYPGMLVVYRETDDNLDLQVAKYGHSVFRLVAGLDSRNGTVSLEAERHRGCYVYAGVKKHRDESLKLECNLDKTNHMVTQAASFEMKEGMSKFHPMSFVAKGAKRNFLLEPLLNYRNETYTVYFNIKVK